MINYDNLLAIAKDCSSKKIGKVAVLMGGIATEREVSLNSGQAVFNALKNKQVDVTLVDITNIEQLIVLKGQFDRVFNVIHGRWGEDGGVQAILSAINMPYVGSNLAACALSMDKLRTKLLWQGLGLSTPEFIIVSKLQPFIAKDYTMGFPVIVKPVREGSSIGMKKANNMLELTHAIDFAKQYDAEILVEKWITGREFTCSIINNTVLPLIELQTTHDFYDFDAKYKTSDTTYICEVDLNLALQDTIKKLSMLAFNGVGAKDWARVDLMLDENNKPWLIELNSVPGMTKHSLMPMAAKQAGLSFDNLVVLLTSLSIGD